MKSIQKKLGTLVMAAQHIGSESDTPKRSLEALAQADLVVFEEAKIARKTLKQAGLTRPYYLFSEHRQQDTLEAVSESLKKGETVCYMSDQGSPTLCDPGCGLTELAFKLGASVRPIPGPSSLTAAMSACPFPLNGFIFTGLLPRKNDQRQKELKKYLSLGLPLVCLDAPYRREALLEAFEDLGCSTRKAFLAFEISTEKESYLCSSLKQLRKQTKSLGKLNFILIISGKN